MKKNKIIFNSSPKPTIGVEAELYTISNQTYNLFSAAPEILSSFKDDKHITEELLECIVEVNTNICKDVSEVRSDLYKKINKVCEKADSMGVSLVSMPPPGRDQKRFLVVGSSSSIASSRFW